MERTVDIFSLKLPSDSSVFYPLLTDLPLLKHPLIEKDGTTMISEG